MADGMATIDSSSTTMINPYDGNKGGVLSAQNTGREGRNYNNL